MSAIELRGVVKNFPSFTLGPIDLKIAAGEFFGIFGPPSTGKSSILKLILGLLDQDDGQVLIGEVDAKHLGVSEREISMVFQNLALFPHMSGRENIAFPLTERGASAAHVARQLGAVSEVLHVEDILNKSPSQMSGGERQRIALGRALAADSAAILLDEPIAALDARLREEMRVELKRLQRANQQTFVYVSHDEEEVMAISDRVAVMIGGLVAQVGAPDDIYNHPASIAVAQVVGTPPMNLFEGRITADGTCFESESFASPLPLPPRYQALSGQPATLGVRPEDVRQTNESGPQCHQIAISSIEPLGGYTIVNAMLGGRVIKIRAAGQIVRAEDHGRRVEFDTRRLHLFDGRGNRISMVSP